MAEFYQLTDHSPVRFAHSVCETVIQMWTDDEEPCEYLEKHILHLGKLHAAIQRLTADILMYEGMNEGWNEANEAGKCVWKMVGWLEEILCVVMDDPSMVKWAYGKKEFLFQGDDA